MTKPREFSLPAEESPSLRVLIVDDEPLIRWSLAETLTDGGHAVTEAGDGETALRLLASGSTFDVIVLDYRLPDSSSLALLSTVRQASPASAIILMTAFGSPEIVEAALGLGAFQVVAKPFEVHEMATLVRHAYLAHRRAPGAV